MTQRPILARACLALAITLAAGPPLPAVAGQAECDAAVKSFEVLAKAPAYAAKMTTPAGDIEMVIINEQAYIKAAGRWTKIPFAKKLREEALKAVMGSKTVTDCEALGRETVAGQEMTVIRYQAPKLEGLPGAPSKAKLWIGRDGLPYRALADDGTFEMVLRYDGVTAPAP